jgi:signal transduction histidine kinase
MAGIGAQSGTAPTASLQLRRVTAIAASAAGCLALLTASQTYLTMLSHGHSFLRLLLWQLGCWGFWALAAPGFVALRGHVRTRRLVLIAIVLAVAHTLFVPLLAMWIQPFAPIAYAFGDLWHRWWFFALVDPLLVALIVVGGRTVANYERTAQLELRETQLNEQLARAQLDALRLEIQPHFLFNTLNSLAALIRANDNPAALSMLLSLSDVMRDTLERTDRQMAPLGRELELIRKYVELQRARFGSRLRVSYQIERAAERAEVPVLLLQPLVENAIRHGIGPRARGGQLVVGATVDSSEFLRLWVSDDGVGLREGFDLAQDSRTGLGNTRARLLHFYGPRAELALRREPGGGTLAEIVMPATGADSGRLLENGAA